MKEIIGAIVGFAFIYFGFVYEFKSQIIGNIVFLFIALNLFALLFKLKKGFKHDTWFMGWWKSKKSGLEWLLLPIMVLMLFVGFYQQQVLRRIGLVDKR